MHLAVLCSIFSFQTPKYATAQKTLMHLGTVRAPLCRFIRQSAKELSVQTTVVHYT